MKNTLKVFIIMAGILSLNAYSEAGKLAVGLNYPGLSARYFFADNIALELKGQYEEGVGVLGLRGYYYFNELSSKKKSGQDFLIFAGLEGSYIDYKGETSLGYGAAAEVFAGVEYFFMKNVSFQMDFGPAYVYLVDRTESSINVGGIEYVVNMGINLYF